MLLFGLLRTAEAEACLPTRLIGREAALEILFDGEFQMRGHLCIQFAVQLSAAEEGAHAM